MKVNSGLRLNVSEEARQAERFNQNRVEGNLFDDNQQPVVGTDNPLFGTSNPAEIEVPPATIGALLSTFADEVIAMFSSDIGEPTEPDEKDNPDERVTESESTASFTA